MIGELLFFMAAVLGGFVIGYPLGLSRGERRAADRWSEQSERKRRPEMRR